MGQSSIISVFLEKILIGAWWIAGGLINFCQFGNQGQNSPSSTVTQFFWNNENIFILENKNSRAWTLANEPRFKRWYLTCIIQNEKKLCFCIFTALENNFLRSFFGVFHPNDNILKIYFIHRVDVNLTLILKPKNIVTSIVWPYLVLN